MRREQHRLADHLGHRREAIERIDRYTQASGPPVSWDSEQVKRDRRKRNRSRAAALTRAGGNLDVVSDSDASAS